MQAMKRQEDDDEFYSLSFKPDRPSLMSKGLKDSREMFSNPKGIKIALKRVADGRQLRAEIKKTQLRPYIP
jgi:hypothetical protein